MYIFIFDFGKRKSNFDQKLEVPVHFLIHVVAEMFGILINNCYVTDGVNKRAQVIDSHGCPIDPILITGIRYSSDLQRAYAESQVFKFADRPGVWFFCQIQMCMKKDGMCDGITVCIINVDKDILKSVDKTRTKIFKIFLKLCIHKLCILHGYFIKKW